ncbi:MAG: RNA-binding protein, partial [Chitinophagaceae bacterium]|nr:RNA-binding protein [Chitinophagaceae bacterium]
TDFVVGNMGTNTQYKCSVTEPLTTYAADFNNDGTIDPVMTRFIQGKAYPAHSRDELVEQMPNLNKRFLKYADYGNATITDVFSKEQLDAAKKFFVYQTASMIFINNKGIFTGKALPIEAQFSCMNGLSFQDYDGDGKKDLLLTGNFYPFRVQQGNNDANFGLLLRGNNKGDFKTGVHNETGLYIPVDARDMVVLKGRTGEQVIVSKNNGGVQVIRPLKVERN